MKIHYHHLLAGLIGMAVVGLSAATRAVETPLSTAASNSLAAEGSGGLFVGVGQFPTNSGLRDLKYSPDDAIALAHLFVVELNLLPAANTRLALAGTPQSKRSSDLLLALRQRGVREISAERDKIVEAMEEVSDLSKSSDGLVVATFSTHGYEAGGTAYIMPSNGRKRSIQESAISLSSIRSLLGQAKANKRILVVDACRETSGSLTKGESVMTRAFRDSFKSAEGFGILASCSAGQLSWEEPGFQQGVFTHFFLEAFRGKVAGANKEGHILLGDVSQFVTAKTKEWVREHRKEDQDPWFEGGETARAIPLMVDPGKKAEEAKLEERRRRAEVLLAAARNKNRQVITPDLQAEVLKALETTYGQSFEDLVTRIERYLEKNDSIDVETFATWWRADGVRLTSHKPNTVDSKRPNSSPAAVSLISNPTGTSPTPAPQPSSPTLSPVVKSKPSFDVQVQSGKGQFWKPEYALTLRDAVAKGLRDQGGFEVIASATDSFRRDARAGTASPNDFTLNIRMEEFRQDLAPRQINLLVKVTTGYIPTTTGKARWTLLSTRERVEKAADAAQGSAQGAAVNLPANSRGQVSEAMLRRSATFPDITAIEELARQIVSQVVKVNPAGGR